MCLGAATGYLFLWIVIPAARLLCWVAMEVLAMYSTGRCYLRGDKENPVIPLCLDMPCHACRRQDPQRPKRLPGKKEKKKATRP